MPAHDAGAPDGALPILFESDEVIAVDKPEGLAVIPERTRTAPCLVERLADQVGGRLLVVHRLDKDVSGVLLLARTEDAHRHLSARFEERRVRKTYAAVVHGWMRETRGRIAAPIRQFGSHRMGVDPRRGKPCLTTYRAIGRTGPCTRLVVHPVTGRRHQIRVHLYSLGHPIVGDRWYGDPAAQAAYPRLLLHARSIVVDLPGGGMIRVVSPTPVSYRRLAQSLGREERIG